MAVTTVAQLAAELNRSASALLEQLQSAGVKKASTAGAGGASVAGASSRFTNVRFLRTSTWMVRALPLASACLISLVDLRVSVIFLRSGPAAVPWDERR